MATLLWPDDKQVQGGLDIMSRRRRVISELANGKNLAVQLQDLLQNGLVGNGSGLAREIIHEILRSFTDCLFLLSSAESGEVCDNGGSKDSDLASKKRSADSDSKNRRGCYKRRRGSETWTELSRTTEDNYAWRKYGQKEILNAKFPRCYFRCTHKHDQGCKATKQVQRAEDDSEIYQITYIGVHTCKRNTRLSPQIITETDPWEELSGGSKPRTNIGHGNVHVPAEVKQEHLEDTLSDVTENSFPSLGSIFDQQVLADACQQLDYLDSVDMDAFMASCIALDGVGDYCEGLL
ncbi:hypothetical protein SAY87_001186 [Trapa incisa]|uniref:WRKY domain-containing protein n=1 Tax=Trapa incisa TaxID=236973 RepID=A0AAN7JHG5_9MYRT|nr:hypothetical protein SAY87_001186 [Trapa incisa]